MHYFDENLKQPASEKQLSYAYDLAARQDMDAELLCNIRSDKQYIHMTKGEVEDLISLLKGEYE